MSGRLAGRMALVTGGSRGIGAAIVMAFAVEGADVAFCHHDDKEGADRVVQALRATGRRIRSANCDVSDNAASAAFFSAAEREFGGIDILVNNAGIGGEIPFSAISMQDFDRMIAVNLRAPFNLSQLAAPGMRTRRWGRIINITSQLAYKGAPGLVHYCAAKAGIVGMTRALAAELAADRVLVNAIAPGLVDTRLSEDLSPAWKDWKISQLPIGRVGLPAEIAPTAVMLASSDGDYYVGQTLSPNGGDVFL
jgi:3-oxoacyl-[acyl-carrier protein] reductase